MSIYRGVILSQFPLVTQRGTVARLYYHAKTGKYTSCIVRRGRCIPDSDIDLHLLSALAHYRYAADGGHCYRPFPGLKEGE